MGRDYPSRHNPHWRNSDSQDRRKVRGEWVGWFLAYVILSLSLLAASFLPWFVLDDTDSAISIAELIPYAMDGPDRTWLVQEAWVYGIVFLYTPFLLVPFLLLVSLAAARDRTAPSMFLISLAGFTLISFGISSSDLVLQHLVARQPYCVEDSPLLQVLIDVLANAASKVPSHSCRPVAGIGSSRGSRSHRGIWFCGDRDAGHGRPHLYSGIRAEAIRRQNHNWC